MNYVIKAEVLDTDVASWTFDDCKTMYGGKSIAVDSVIFLFSSENQGGKGLFARGFVLAVSPNAGGQGVARQTPRVSVNIARIGLAKRPLGRLQLKNFTNWDDGQPGTELNFKLYRQATNKIVGISDRTAAFLAGFF